MTRTPTVFIVDDDAAVRRSLSRSLQERGYDVAAFESAQAFLDATGGSGPGCLVLDVLMPEMTGLELQSTLQRLGSELPIIFVTGHGTISMAARTLRQGAVDFLEKPYPLETLVQRIDEALQLNQRLRTRAGQTRRARVRLRNLTDRERQVFDLLTASAPTSSKEIARTLGISHRTVEVHRGRIMQKTRAQSVTDLVRLAALSGEPEDRT